MNNLYLEYYHKLLYFLFKSFKEIVLRFLLSLATPMSTSTSTQHRLMESIRVLLTTFTESTIPASNKSTIFYCLMS